MKKVLLTTILSIFLLSPVSYLLSPLLAAPCDDLAGKGNTLFEVKAPATVKAVTLSGEFNKWDPSSIPMVKCGEKWIKRLNLNKGKYEYKFLADGNWDTLNPNNQVITVDKDPVADVSAVGGAPKARFVTFQYTPVIKASSVALVGSFNNWNGTANPMTESAGRWESSLFLEDGEYTYKFLVNGNQWLPDPNNAASIDDGFGGKNSILKVGAQLGDVDVKRGDGKIYKAGILFDAKSLLSADIDGKDLIITLRAFNNDIDSVTLLLNGIKIPMPSFAKTAAFEYFRAVVPVPQAAIQCAFLIQDGKTVLRLGGTGLQDKPDESLITINQASASSYKTPGWVRDAIFYQIFPERFNNGDKSNDLNTYYPIKPRPAGKAWDIGDNYLEDWNTGKPAYGNTFGGDLRGIIEKLPYIKSLGINAIYLNPVFRSPSNHKYDTIDYFSIDPQFGTLADFKELITKAHAMGLRVILDGVFNHTADESLYFQDVEKNGPQSQYYTWYQIKKWPFPGGFPPKFGPGENEPKNFYDCWWGFGDMPKLNYKTQAVRDFILKVGAYWVGEMGADGWRLDVPNEVPHDFWKQFRIAIRKANPEAYITGEIWGNAQEWLQGDEFDAVMNYRLRDALFDFFVKEKTAPDKFAQAIEQFKVDYPRQANAVMFNLIGSHDTPRFLTVAENNTSKFLEAVTFQMFYPGAPTIYNGDEIGTQGDKDPDNRRPFLWDETKWDKKINTTVKKLIALRNTYPALRQGNIQPYLTDNAKNVVLFTHSTGKDLLLSAFNNSSSVQTVDIDLKALGFTGALLKDEVTGATMALPGGKGKLPIPAKSGMLFVLR